MDPLTIGLIIGFISFVGSIITAGVNQSNVQRTNQTNRQIAQDSNEAAAQLSNTQHDQSVADWRMQNAYNSPEAQMQRFRDAGLNPSLIYGQMSNSPSVQSTSNLPSFVSPTMQPFRMDNPFSGNTASDILSIAQANKAEAETSSILEKLPEEVKNLQESNRVLQAQVSELNKKVELYSSQITSMGFDNQLKAAQTAKNYFDMNLASATFERDSNKVLAEINYLRSLSSEADSRTELNKRNLYELRESWSYRLLGFDLENTKIASEIGLNRAKVVESNFVAQQIGLDIQAGRLHAAVNQSLYDTSFGGKGSKLEQRINRALLTITDYFGKSAVSIGNGLQSAGALKMLLK